MILFLAALFVTIGENLGIVSWNNVYKNLGITDSTDAFENYDISAHFIDVGKADSIYVKFKDKNILVDAGEKDTYNTVLEYLKKKSVKKLDMVIASHPHSDHIGGFPEILNEFKITKILMPKLRDEIVPTSKVYENFLLAIEKNKIPVDVPSPGDVFKLGDLKIEIFAPNKQYESVNNNSIVAKLTYKNVSFLFTGDAEKESEEDMLNKNFDIKSTILKVGHHGSKTSTSNAFLKRVNPEYAVICVGEDKYNLPKKETINKLKKCGAKIYRTDLHGTVVLATNGEDIKVSTSR